MVVVESSKLYNFARPEKNILSHQKTIFEDLKIPILKLILDK
jgi:hypothetical protein